jgi:hypothetical protein
MNSVPLDTMTPQVTDRELTADINGNENHHHLLTLQTQRDHPKLRLLSFIWFISALLGFGAFVFGLCAVYDDPNNGGTARAEDARFVASLVFLSTIGACGMAWVIRGFIFVTMCHPAMRYNRTREVCGMTRRERIMVQDDETRVEYGAGDEFVGSREVVCGGFVPVVMPVLRAAMAKAR